MRTEVLKEQVKYYYGLLNLEVEDVTANGNSYKRIKNWKSISLALYKLNEFDFMGDSVKNIFDMGANFAASTETTGVHINNYNNFVVCFNIVRAKCEAIINLEKGNTNSENAENNLYVKLPSDLKDLDDLQLIIKDLDVIFKQCPILRDTYKEVDFLGVDTGSNWLVLNVILVGAPIVAKSLNWIADFIKKCNDIRMQNREIRKADLEYIISKTEFEEKKRNELIQKIENKIQEDHKEQYIEEFKNIKIPADKEISPEDEGKIVYCMSRMIELLDKGIEMYPSVKCSDEVKDAFPKKEEWKKIENNVKLIEDGKKDKNK